MEPMTPLDKEFFQRKNLIDLVRIIVTNYVCDWEVHSACLALEYINCIKKLHKLNYMELETIIDMEFLQKIDPDFMIID